MKSKYFATKNQKITIEFSTNLAPLDLSKLSFSFEDSEAEEIVPKSLKMVQENKKLEIILDLKRNVDKVNLQISSSDPELFISKTNKLSRYKDYPIKIEINYY